MGIRPAIITLVVFSISPCFARIIIVDNNGPADFNNIQAAVNDANNGDTVVIQPGIYTGDGNRDINVSGKAITIRSIDPNDPCIAAATIVDCNAKSGNFHLGFQFNGYHDANLVTLAGLTITNAYSDAIFCENHGPVISRCIIKNNHVGIYCTNHMHLDCIVGSPRIEHCLITNNTGSHACGVCANGHAYPLVIDCVVTGNQADGVGAINHGVLYVSNCTITNNKNYGVYCEEGCPGLPFSAEITNSIIWNNASYEIYLVNLPEWANVKMSYSDLQGGLAGVKQGTISKITWGPGNIDVDPCFAQPGYWVNINDPNIPVEPNNPNAVWAGKGDYHLQSAAGRWDPNQTIWVTDVNTSACIDTGDPNSDWTKELWPHGKQINIGAYGGTPEASMSLSTIGNIANLDNDPCDIVDLNDFALFVDKWCYQEHLLAEDLDRNGQVDFNDFAIFGEQYSETQ